MTNTSQQQGFYHRGSPRSNSPLYSIFACEYYNHALHNSDITANRPETVPFTQTRGILYEGSLLSSAMIEQTIIQAALSSIKTFDGTKSKFEAWTECSPNLTWMELKRQLSVQCSAIPFDSHATQDFCPTEEGLDELPEMYLHCASELL